jgi:AcrR family transcriptional regulator
MNTMTSAAGSGPRHRILAAASDLFYRKGILATGVEELAETARVSKRTLYQQFPSKDAVIVAYLDGITFDDLGPAMTGLLDSSRPARDRLIGLFEPGSLKRGCPFLNVAVEFADPAHPARVASERHKQQMIESLTKVAKEAGARDPRALAFQLSVLSDGARAQAVALGSTAPLDYARQAAEALLQYALD